MDEECFNCEGYVSEEDFCDGCRAYVCSLCSAKCTDELDLEHSPENHLSEDEELIEEW